MSLAKSSKKCTRRRNHSKKFIITLIFKHQTPESSKYSQNQNVRKIKKMINSMTTSVNSKTNWISNQSSPNLKMMSLSILWTSLLNLMIPVQNITKHNGWKVSTKNRVCLWYQQINSFNSRLRWSWTTKMTFRMDKKYLWLNWLDATSRRQLKTNKTINCLSINGILIIAQD